MKPTTIARTHLETPAGLLEISAGHRGICGVIFPEKPQPALAPDHVLLQQAVAQLSAYFAGTLTVFDLPLDMPGPAFHQRVWQKLLEIPYGRRMTYGELAVLLENPGASRAVGMANSQNPVSIIVPCHRVVGGKHSLTDNDLRGYAGGLPRKRWLLQHEQDVLMGRQTVLFG